MRNLNKQQLQAMQSRPMKPGGGIREEIAGLAQGDPLAYDSYMQKTRYEAWLIALGGG
jgi:hypothetical protein